MIELTWISLGAAVLTSLLAYIMWAQTYWRRRGIVQTQPRFIIGDFGNAVLRKQTLGEVLQKHYRLHKTEPFVGIYKQLTPVLVVRDPELVQEVLSSNFSSFANNEVLFPEGSDEVFSNNPFFAPFTRWKELRFRISQLFNPSRVKMAFGDLDISSRYLANFIAGSGSDASFDGLLLCKRFTAHASARVLFGIESHSLEIGSEPGVFYEMGHNIFNGGFMHTLRLTAIRYFPPLLHLIGFNLVDSSIRNFFRMLIRDAVNYRVKEGLSREDFVHYATKTILVDEKLDDAKLSKMTAQAINSFVETFETTALTLSSVLLMLATNPREQERLRVELRERLKPDQPLNYDTVAELPFLDQIIKETMRLYPAVDTTRRRCTRAVTLRSVAGAAVDVALGTPVYIPVHSLHRDPAYYSHPEDFWPDHFSAAESEGRPKSVFLGWGSGPRMCPGIMYASTTIKTAVVSLVRRFEISPGEKQVLPVRRDPSANIIHFVGGIWLKFKNIP